MEAQKEIGSSYITSLRSKIINKEISGTQGRVTAILDVKFIDKDKFIEKLILETHGKGSKKDNLYVRSVLHALNTQKAIII